MILKIVGAGLAVISFGGLLLCAVGFFSPRTFYRSTDRDCLRLRFAGGGAGIVYDGAADAFETTGLSGKLLGIVLSIPFDFQGGWREHQLFAPPWILVPLLAIYPIVLLLRRPLRNRRRIRAGLCLECGYNLTGNVTGLCSECGTPILRNSKLFRKAEALAENI